jgi:TonB-dependent starch-binding outer membrane protein SusC
MFNHFKTISMKKQSTFLKILFLFLVWALSVNANAQDVKITGKVTDAIDGSSLPGVSIVVKGTTSGTITDIDGKFSLSVNTGATLEFSFIGYVKQEVVIGTQRTLTIALKSSATGLSEVVVIGYGQVKKSDATGAVAAVGSKDFNKGAITSPAQLLLGKVTGVQISTSGGSPGSDATIRIRGGASLSASNDPLFVIDGVPVDNDGISGSRGALSTINPSDIETFTVLKDASATAIYGSRASNGVILITTKKGMAGQGKNGSPIALEYSGNFSYYTIPKTIEVLSANDFRSLINEKFSSKASLMGDASTDWQNEIFKNAFAMDHNLSASGSYKTMPYRISLGYSDQDGILKTDNMKRTSLGFALSPSFFDNHLKVDINAKRFFIKNHFADQGAIGAALQFDPTKPVMSGDTAYGGYTAWLQADGKPVGQATSNPVALLYMRSDNSEVNRSLGNVQFDYKFHFIPELRANLNLGLDHSISDGTRIIPPTASWLYDADKGGGENRVYNQKKKNELLDFYLNYVKNLNSINSKIDVMGGYSWQHFWRTNTSRVTNSIGTVERENINDPTESYLVSFFGRLNYTFNDKYLLTATLRDDGSSRFSKDNRWGLFPAAALAWKISDEPFLKGSNTISQLKLRAGWGVTGQQNITDNDYPYQPRYTSSETTAGYELGGVFYTTLRPEAYDVNIKWEETTTTNIGLDYGFAKDKVFGSIEVYQRKTKDLINKIPIPAGTNLSNQLLTNIGDMENKGVEFSITTRPVAKEKVFWEIGINATYNTNKITKLTATDDPNYLGAFTGGISGGVGNTIKIQSVGFPANSFFVYEQVYDPSGKPIEGLYVDRNKDGKIDDNDRYHYKNPAADYFFGISSRLTIHNWDFSFSGRANLGNYVYNNVSSSNGVYERLYRPEGPYLSNVTADVNEAGFTTPQYLSDYYIQEASFFKMDNMSLSYAFKGLWKSKTVLRLSATVNNVFTITKYKGIDPEVNSTDNTVGAGIDNNIYPRSRVFVFGINLQY